MANTDVKFKSPIFRKDHAMILAAKRELASIKSVRLKDISADYSAGQVLARNSSTGLYEKYSAVSGTYAAACILFEDVPTQAFDESSGGGASTSIARGIFGGEVYTDKCIDLSSGAKTDLKGREVVDADSVSIFKY